MARKDDQLLQTGRRHLDGRNNQRGTPRVIWLALLVALIGAFLLFRQPGGGQPTGIGENRSVITVPADDLDTLVADLDIADSSGVVTSAPAQPRSGQVEMKDIARDLTPEKPSGNASTSVPSPAAETNVVTKPAPKPKPAPTKPVSNPEPVVPAADGPYLVQTGSFGNADNADREAARLRTFGWDARVKVSGTADGELIYRVRIGFFPDRKTAQKFIHSNSKTLRGAIAVHR